MVAAIILAAHAPQFSKAVREKIERAVDTEDLEKQLVALPAELRQTLDVKPERQMDMLDTANPRLDRKILDIQRRYDERM